jgi:hypothetical protein
VTAVSWVIQAGHASIQLELASSFTSRKKTNSLQLTQRRKIVIIFHVPVNNNNRLFALPIIYLMNHLKRSKVLSPHVELTEVLKGIARSSLLARSVLMTTLTHSCITPCITDDLDGHPQFTRTCCTFKAALAHIYSNRKI